MATTTIGTNSEQAVKLWSAMTFRQMLAKTLTAKLMGGADDKNAIVYRKNDLQKTAGDTVKFDIFMQATGNGVTGDARLRGHEEALVYHQDSITVDQLRQAHSFTRISSQRTLHDLRKDAHMSLTDWWAGTMDSYMFRYLCGDTTINHGQAGLAPDSAHYFLSGGKTVSGVVATDEGTLTSADVITLSDIDIARERGEDSDFILRPVNIDGGEYYVLVLHPFSVTNLKLDAAKSSYVSWPEIQMYANKRGLKNPLFTGALGVYNQTIIMSSSRIYSPRANVHRNLFLGAQAGCIAFANAWQRNDMAKGKREGYLSWYEELDDFGNEMAIAAGAIFGLKKTRFNSQDYGTFVISSYSRAHGKA
jgi:N4-gp56 family major capsid protein